MATRCCWPPDNSLGRCSLLSPNPTAFSASRAVLLASPADLPSSSKGNSTFSTAESTGSKLKSWNMKPKYSARILERSSSLTANSDLSSIVTVPEVGSSMPDRTLSKVVLPQPEGPMIAIISPSPILTLTPLTA